MPHEIEGGRATGSIKEGLSKSWQGKLQLGVVCQLPTSHVDHAGPCRTMQDHAGLCRTMQDYAGLCRTMQDYAGLCRTMQDHAGLCRTMQDHAGLCRTMQDHAGPCRTMQDYAGLCRTMQDYAGPCRTMQGQEHADLRPKRLRPLPFPLLSCWTSKCMCRLRSQICCCGKTCPATCQQGLSTSGT